MLQQSTPTTVLDLLTLDGAITASFQSPLSSDQYSELYQLLSSKEYSHFTTKELCSVLGVYASLWGIGLILDEY